MTEQQMRRILADEINRMLPAHQDGDAVTAYAVRHGHPVYVPAEAALAAMRAIQPKESAHVQTGS